MNRVRKYVFAYKNKLNTQINYKKSSKVVIICQLLTPTGHYNKFWFAYGDNIKNKYTFKNFKNVSKYYFKV